MNHETESLKALNVATVVLFIDSAKIPEREGRYAPIQLLWATARLVIRF